MSSQKVNMSLDDIIKLNKKDARTQKQQKGARKMVVNRGPKQIRGGRAGPAGNVRRIGARGVQKVARGRVQSEGPVGAQKKLLQNMVKKAVKKALMGGSRPAPFAGRGVLGRQPAILNRLSGINNRSGLLQRRPNPSQVQRIVQARAPRQVIRAPRQQIRAPRQQVTQIVERIIERPVIRQARQQVIRRQPVQVVREVVQQQQQPRRNQRIVGGQRQQRVVVQRVQQQPRQRVQQVIQRVQQAPRIQRQAAPARRQRTMVVERSVPRVQRTVIRRPVQVVRQQPAQRVQYVEMDSPRQNFGRQNRQQRGVRTVIQRTQRAYQDERFEPSTSFIDRRSVVRRGRGFQNRF